MALTHAGAACIAQTPGFEGVFDNLGLIMPSMTDVSEAFASRIWRDGPARILVEKAAVAKPLEEAADLIRVLSAD